ncbi:MAG TPA: hypothetical protein VGI39_35850 [Polyangiaceae bacterium]|jgi:hypothetical protein
MKTAFSALTSSAAAALLIASAAAGCSSSSPNSSTSTGCVPSACSLVKDTEVSAAFGGTYSGTESDLTASLMQCNYDAASAASVDVIVTCSGVTVTDTQLKTDLSGAATVTAVSGLGAAAEFGAPADGTQTGAAYKLEVADGTRELSINYFPNGKSSVDPLTAAKAVATAALGRM